MMSTTMMTRSEAGKLGGRGNKASSPVTSFTRPRLAELLEQAKPYAERLVYERGIVCELAHDDTGADAEGFFQARGEWLDAVVPADYDLMGRTEGGALYDAAHRFADASYILGIAVGLLLRR